MTRLALASFGCGLTLGIVLVALLGSNSSLALGFAAGLAFACLVLFLCGLGVVWVGWKFGWVKAVIEHSQHGGD